ncbi:24780_t:CDS:2, partial [Dentiscutata erythropus]
VIQQYYYTNPIPTQRRGLEDTDNESVTEETNKDILNPMALDKLKERLSKLYNKDVEFNLIKQHYPYLNTRLARSPQQNYSSITKQDSPTIKLDSPTIKLDSPTIKLDSPTIRQDSSSSSTKRDSSTTKTKEFMNKFDNVIQKCHQVFDENPELFWKIHQRILNLF